MFFAELCPSVVPSAHSSQLPLGSLPNEVWNSLKSYKSNGCYKLFPVPLCFILLVHQYMNATKLKAKYFALLGNVLSAFNKSQKPRSVQGRATQTTKAWWKKKKGQRKDWRELSWGSKYICIWTTERKRFIYIQ